MYVGNEFSLSLFFRILDSVWESGQAQRRRIRQKYKRKKI